MPHLKVLSKVFIWTCLGPCFACTLREMMYLFPSLAMNDIFKCPFTVELLLILGSWTKFLPL